MQRGFTPGGRHEKSQCCTMDESSILRRRGLQVGRQCSRACVGSRRSAGFDLQDDFVLYVYTAFQAPVLLFRQSTGL